MNRSMTFIPLGVLAFLQIAVNTGCGVDASSGLPTTSLDTPADPGADSQKVDQTTNNPGVDPVDDSASNTGNDPTDNTGADPAPGPTPGPGTDPNSGPGSDPTPGSGTNPRPGTGTVPVPPPPPEPPPAPAPTGFGDGSGGVHVVSSDEDWTDPAQLPANLQFTNLTVVTFATLTVPSGLTIRCTENCLINGTIIVRPGAVGGTAVDTTPDDPFDDLSVVLTPAEGGLGGHVARNGSLRDNSDRAPSTPGGLGISEDDARHILSIANLKGGGGGSAGFDRHDGITDDIGSAGGGSIRILAEGSITIPSNGSILADGESGSGGGGAGGIIILASRSQLVLDGAVTAKGGDGEDSDSDEGPSGGGGGGIIRMSAPEFRAFGTVNVAGGRRGEIGATPVASVFRFSGGGGGGCLGAGGHGGSVPAGAFSVPGPASDGQEGIVFEFVEDPTHLFE